MESTTIASLAPCTHEELCHRYHYDPDTGHVLWKNPPPGRGRAGARAGTVQINHKGRVIPQIKRKITIKGNKYQEHAIVWYYMTGVWVYDLNTGQEIDHIDRDSANNVWSNLRLATRYQNNCNTRKRQNRSSKYKGVFYDKKSGKWRAYIYYELQRYNLGSHEHEVDAARAYNAKALELHGEFAVLNEID
jgi:HNH endonuclease/AP2 domain